jgi:predicted RNase H-like HicB family nuclease
MNRGVLVLLIGVWGGWLAMPLQVEARGREHKNSLTVAGGACAQECQQQARHVYEECTEAGGTRQECLERARRFLRECMDDCEAAPTCAELCRLRAELVYQECLALGGSEDECRERASAFFDLCVEDHCRPADSCETRCIQRARAAQRECVAAGNDPDECAERAREILRACVAEHCPPTAPDCEERCARVTHEVYEECLEAGGSEDDCAARARTAFERCINMNCSAPPDCEQRCIHEARRQYEECVEAGDDPDECALRARTFLRHCVDENCAEPPTCEQRCAHRAEELARVCVENGGDVEECRERARKFLERCIGDECRGPIDCRQRCARQALIHLESCLADGNDFLTCAKAARELYLECVSANCPTPLNCTQRCERVAREVYRACIAAGNPEDECRLRAEEALEHCIRANCARRCGGIVGEPCEDNEFCNFPPGTCGTSGAIGVCTPLPDNGCPLVFDPVCGCDGVTYGNGCMAAAEGVSIDYFGPCQTACDPSSTDPPCGEDEFCKLPPGVCAHQDALGRCAPVPQGCPDIWDPVCGCDGVTYSNECDADAARVSIAHRGECQRPCYVGDEYQCNDDEFCLRETGTCATTDLNGVCVRIPTVCPDVWLPVCGCDGETYGNRCEAIMAGVQIAHAGECHDLCGGFTGIPCDDGEFCRLPRGTCNSADLMGICAEIPNACPRVWAPVCGCDGVTYGNECEALRAGVQIDHAGVCLSDLTCRSNDDCSNTTYCQFIPGQCEPTNAVGGLCVPRPLHCPNVWAPVCGCDGETFGNACRAAAAGVSIRHDGQCQD